MDERCESFGVRPKAVVLRFYSDGSYEEFWELKRHVAHEQIFDACSIR
jgi:hypothetical protein